MNYLVYHNMTILTILGIQIKTRDHKNIYIYIITCTLSIYSNKHKRFKYNPNMHTNRFH